MAGEEELLRAYGSLAEVGPGTRGGRYLRRHWHPIARDTDLAAGEVRRLRLLGETFTLVRFEDGAHALFPERCPHRGMPLHLGELREGALRCPYHGWAFDRAGRCVDAPGEPGRTCPAGADAFPRPLESAYGLIFAHVGEEPPPPFPHGGREDVPRRRLAPIVWPVSHLLRLENTTDVTHLGGIHRASGHADHLPASYEVRVDEGETGHRLQLVAEGSTVFGRPLHFRLPNLFHYWQPALREGVWYEHLTWHVPAEHALCRTFTVVFVPGADAEALRRDEPRQSAGEEVSLARSVLAGERRLADLAGHANLTEIEDCVAVLGQEEAGGVFPSTLGVGDAGVRALRRSLGADLLRSEAGEWAPAVGPAEVAALLAASEGSAA